MYLLTILISICCTITLAQPVYWPANGHYYEFVPTLLNWDDAARDAANRVHNGWNGYLATITSQEEHDFIRSNIAILSTEKAFLGGRDYSEGIWKWETGPEAGQVIWRSYSGCVGFCAWNFGEPNDSGDEDILELVPSGVWNDIPAFATRGFLVEYSVPEAPVFNPANGHHYQRIFIRKNWQEAKMLAERMEHNGFRGYLATITSQEEMDFLRNNIASLSQTSVWLGASDADVEGEWKWVAGPESGTIFWTTQSGCLSSYCPWGNGEPNNAQGIEHALELFQFTFNDNFVDTFTFQFLVEYDGALCGNDIVEFGEECDNPSMCCMGCKAVNSGSVCEPAQSVCDMADVCNMNGMCVSGGAKKGHFELSSAMCARCFPGTYNDEDTAQISCKSCPAGTFTAAYNATHCTPCAPGWFSKGGATVCAKCPVGSYSDMGAEACIPCPPGTSTNGQIGQARCSDCMAGTYAKGGAAKCLACPKGSYNGMNMGTLCKPCPAETYSAILGATVCMDCAPNTYAYGGSSTCANCPSPRPNSKIGAVCENA